MRALLLIPAAVLCSFATACTVTEVKTSAPDEQPGNDGSPGESEDEDTPGTDEPGEPAAAKPPSLKLDTGFAPITDSKNDVYSAAPGPDGLTYVALRRAGGAIGWGSGTLLRRYLPSGSLDTSFAAQGELDTKLVANPQALAVDGTGRVLVGGTGLYDPDTTNDTGREIVVVRVTPAGVVDATYGSAGRAKLSFAPANTSTTSLRVRTDGGALVNVYGRTSGNDSFGNFLVGAGGTAVSGYGTAGFRSSPFPTDGALASGTDVLVPTQSGLVRYGEDGASKGTAIQAGVLMAKEGPGGAFSAVVSDGKSFSLARFSADGKKDKSFAASPITESFADFEVLEDGSVLLADGGQISWVAKTGGAATVLVEDAGAATLATTSDGKLLVTTSGSSGKVQRYVY